LIFGGIVDHHCLNFLLFCWYWWNCIPPISTKQRNLNSDGQQFHQYEQIEKSRQWWSTIPPISTKQKKG
jgi:hypothetical protein